MQWTTLPARRVEPAHKEKYKGHARHELPNAAADTQVTNRSLAAHSPEYSVPLTAAVTHGLVCGWIGGSVGQWVGQVKSLKNLINLDVIEIIQFSLQIDDL